MLVTAKVLHLPCDVAEIPLHASDTGFLYFAALLASL